MAFRAPLVRFVRVFSLGVCVFSPAVLADVGREGPLLAEALALRDGSQIADVGAGAGEYAVDLAGRVGAAGHVYATEVDEAELEKIRTRVASAGISNVTALKGDKLDTGLGQECCDAILLRLVYHHFTDVPAMQGSLWKALRPGGRIAIVDVPPQRNWRQLEGVPERGGHGIEASELIRDMRRAGFELVSRQNDWPAEIDAYCVVFRKPGSS